MEAIVLAGGLGTRLRRVVSDVPKPMAPVCGRPFLEILLTALSAGGFERIIVSLGYKADMVISHFGVKFCGMELCYEIEDTPLGTGGAVRKAIQQCRDDHVFVFNGDTFLDLEVAQVESLWCRNGRPIIVSREVADASRYGGLDVSDGRIRGFLEKGITGPGLINAGCYIFPRRGLNKFPAGQPFSLESDFLGRIVSETPVDVFITHGYFIDIGVPEDYARAQTELARFA